MKKLCISCHGKACGILEETVPGSQYSFTYDEDYKGPPVSLTMPVHQKSFIFQCFPPFFDGLLPEGFELEGLVRRHKISHNDYMIQLELTGSDLSGAVTIHSVKKSK